MIAIIAEIIASVEPQQTVISRSGSIATSLVRENLSAIALRRDFAPQVIAYWLMSAAIASCAARLISAGAGKSGKPCERLTALCCRARRVISRMTDSVNWAALDESRELVAGASSGFAGFILCASHGLRRAVQLTIDVGVACNDFDVLASFGERDRIHKLGRLAIGLPGGPESDAIFSGVVGRERRLHSAEIALQAGKINRPDVNVVIRFIEHGSGVANFGLLGEAPRGFREKLHQTKSVRAGVRLWIVRG